MTVAAQTSGGSGLRAARGAPGWSGLLHGLAVPRSLPHDSRRRSGASSETCSSFGAESIAWPAIWSELWRELVRAEFPIESRRLGL